MTEYNLVQLIIAVTHALFLAIAHKVQVDS